MRIGIRSELDPEDLPAVLARVENGERQFPSA